MRWGSLGGAPVPELATLAAAAAVGFFGYGVSLVLFVLGLRHLGAARTGAYFSTAPFIGAALALPLFGETPTLALMGAALLMGFGVYLHLVECTITSICMGRSSMNIATCMTSITSINMRRTRRPASLIAIGTGTRSFCTSIRTIRTSTTATSTSTRERTKRPEPGSPK